MDCPVCHKKNIESYVHNCPECETDLLQFSIFDMAAEDYLAMTKRSSILEGKVVELEQKRKRDRNNYVGKIYRNLFFLSLLGLIYFLFFKKPPQPEIVPDQATIENLKKQHETQTAQLKKDLEDAKNQIEGIKAQTNVKSIQYVIQKDDILWQLGELFYNNRLAAYQIAKDNDIPEEKFRLLPVGDTITLNFRCHE